MSQDRRSNPEPPDPQSGVRPIELSRDIIKLESSTGYDPASTGVKVQRLSQFAFDDIFKLVGTAGFQPA